MKAHEGYAPPIPYLSPLPVHALKVDISLMRDLGRDPAVPGVTQGIVQMAAYFWMSRVVEGVEKTEIDVALRK